MSFPTPPAHLSKFEPHYNAQLTDGVSSVLSSHLRATEGTAAFPSTADDLEEHVWSEIRIATRAMPERPWEGRHGVSTASLGRMVDKLSAGFLESYKPAVPRGPFAGRFKRPFTVEEARKGGQTSKRAARLLTALRTMDVRGLTVAAIAAILDCTERYVYKLRALLRIEREAAARAAEDAAFEAELNTLFPETDDAPEVEDDADAAEVAAFVEAMDLDPFAGLLNTDTQADSGIEAADTASEQVEVRITGMRPPIHIHTRRPISALQAAIEEFAAEEAAGPYARMAEYPEVAL